MNTLLKNTTLSLFVVALSVLSAGDSSAGLRARVEVEKKLGPANLRVRLHTPDVVRWNHAPVRERHHAPRLHVSARDRRIAHRLAIITGISERPLLKKRARGIGWNRIAYVHGISKREMKIAKNPHRFDRWLARNAWACGAPDDDRGKPGRGGRGGRGR